MKIANLCILIPVYREKISDDETVSLEYLKKNASGESIFFIAPEGLKTENYHKWGWNFIFFPKKFFVSVNEYTKLLLSPFFYEKFKNYEYMLICQTDALLLRSIEQIKPFLEAGYDYIGAPWPGGYEIYSCSFKGISAVKKFFHPQICNVGNGGFSLRNIPNTIALLKEKKIYTYIWNTGEDCFFAYYGLKNHCGFRVAPLELAYRFAVEKDAKEQITNGRRPLGIHGWKKHYPDILLKEKR